MTLAGLRPGEKLYEELLVKTEELDKTDKRKDGVVVDVGTEGNADVVIVVSVYQEATVRPSQFVHQLRVESLFRTYLKFVNRFPRIRFKIFLRNDIWSTLEFVNKSHISDKCVELSWDENSLLFK